MNNLKSGLLLLFYFLVIFQLSAQKKIEKGYIINLEGDTIRGLILDKDKRLNPKNIAYSGGGVEKTYFPEDILEFAVNNQIFQSFKIEYDTSKFRTNDLTVYNEPLWKQEVVFLQLLVKGELDLYSLTDHVGKNHFFIKSENDDVPKELLLIRYKKGTDIATITRYRNVLRRYMDSAPQLYERIQKVAYNEAALRKLFVMYNEHKNHFDYQHIPKKIKLKFSVSGGLTSMKVTDTKEAVFSNNHGVSGGIAMEVIFPKNKRKWSLYNELGHRGYKTSVEDVDVTFVEGAAGENYTIKLGYIRLLNAIKFNVNGYNKSNLFSPFIYAGIVNGFFISNDSTYEPTFGPQAGQPTPLDNFRNHEQSVAFGLGADFKSRIGLDLRYEYSNGFSPFLYYGTRVRTLFLQVRFIF